jgi:hypothetical protein
METKCKTMNVARCIVCGKTFEGPHLCDIEVQPAEPVAVPQAPPELEYDRHRDKLTPYWQKKVNAFRVEIAEQDDGLCAANERIAVLEARLGAVADITLDDGTQCWCWEEFSASGVHAGWCLNARAALEGKRA